MSKVPFSNAPDNALHFSVSVNIDLGSLQDVRPEVVGRVTQRTEYFRVGVVTVLGQVALEARQRRELLADAAVAGEQHLERLVEGRGFAAGKVEGDHDAIREGDQRRASAPQGDLVTATDTM